MKTDHTQSSPGPIETLPETHAVTRPLCLRADDFGASPGTNEAIIDAIDCGTVRNVSVLACGPYLKHSLGALLERADQVAIGLHTAINSERAKLRWGPVASSASVPSLLAEDGAFHAKVETSAQTARLEEVLIELNAQLDRLRSIRLNPVYADCHMCFSSIDGWLEPILDFCQREGLLFADAPTLPKLKIHSVPNWADLPPASLFEQVAGLAPPARVWVWHPAYADAISLRFGRRIAEQRDKEAKLLIHPDFARAMERNHFHSSRLA